MFQVPQTVPTSPRPPRASRPLALILACVGAIAALTACDETEAEDSHPLVGTWLDDFGFEHQITDDTWESAGSAWVILEVDLSGEVLFAQNDPSNGFAPGLYSRFDWVFDDAGELRYCQSAFDAASLEAAKAAPRADDTNLDMGCGGFVWSTLAPY